MIESYNEHFPADYLELQKKEKQRIYLNSIFRIPDEDQKNNLVINKNFNKNNFSNHLNNISPNASSPFLHLEEINNSKFNHLNFPNPFIMQNNTERNEKYHFNLNGYFPDEMIQNNNNNFFYNSDNQRKTDSRKKNKKNQNNQRYLNKNNDNINAKNIINDSNFQIDKNPAQFQYKSSELIALKNFDKNNFPNYKNNKKNSNTQQKKSNKISNSVNNLNNIPDSNNFLQNNDFPQKNHLTQPLNNNKQNKLNSKKIYKTIDSAQAYKLRYKNTGYHYNFEFIPQLNNNYIQNSLEQDFINNNLIDNENNAYIYQNQDFDEQEIQNNINNNIGNKVNNINENIINNNENKDNSNDFEEEYFYYKENCNPPQNANGIDYYQGQDTIKEVNEDMEYSSSERKSIDDINKKQKLLQRSNTQGKLKNNYKKINTKLGYSNCKTMKNNKTMSNKKKNQKKNQKQAISKKLNNSTNLVNKRILDKKEQKLKQFLIDCNFGRNPEISLNYPKTKRDKNLCNSHKMIENKQKLKSIENDYKFSFTKMIKNYEFKDDFFIKKNMKKNVIDLIKTKKQSKTKKKKINTGLFEDNSKIKKGIIDKEKIIKKRRVKTPLPSHLIEKNGDSLFKI